MRTPQGTTAVRRLRRARYVTTLVSLAATSACLVVLALIAVHSDNTSRRRDVETDVGQRASRLADVVSDDTEGLDLSALQDNVTAQTASAFGVIDHRSIRLALPDQSAMPADAVLKRLLDRSGTNGRLVRTVAPGPRGLEYYWAAAPVLRLGKVGAIVLVGGPLPRAAAHRRLVDDLVITCIALVLLAAAMGHLISGRAMRPALRSIERQEQFLTEAAHELRTPLTTLGLVLETGLADRAEGPPALQRATVLVADMGRLVTQLLSRARIQAGTAQTDLVSLRLDQVVETTLADMPLQVPVHVTTSPSVVRGDADLLAQAIRNLVENAIRHGAGTPVEVTVADGVVAVRDRGPGIAANRRGEVLRSGTGSGDGTGTGLAIVSWVMSVHHGTLRLLDAPGGGLLVELEVPR